MLSCMILFGAVLLVQLHHAAGYSSFVGSFPNGMIASRPRFQDCAAPRRISAPSMPEMVRRTHIRSMSWCADDHQTLYTL